MNGSLGSLDCLRLGLIALDLLDSPDSVNSGDVVFFRSEKIFTKISDFFGGSSVFCFCGFKSLTVTDFELLNGSPPSNICKIDDKNMFCNNLFVNKDLDIEANNGSKNKFTRSVWTFPCAILSRCSSQNRSLSVIRFCVNVFTTNSVSMESLLFVAIHTYCLYSTPVPFFCGKFFLYDGFHICTIKFRMSSSVRLTNCAKSSEQSISFITIPS